MKTEYEEVCVILEWAIGGLLVGLVIGAVIASFISFRKGYNRRKNDAEAEIFMQGFRAQPRPMYGTIFPIGSNSTINSLIESRDDILYTAGLGLWLKQEGISEGVRASFLKHPEALKAFLAEYRKEDTIR